MEAAYSDLQNDPVDLDGPATPLLDPGSTSELIFDRFEQMEFAFAEAHQAAQSLTVAMEEAIGQMQSLHTDLKGSGHTDLQAQIAALPQLLGTDAVAAELGQLGAMVRALSEQLEVGKVGAPEPSAVDQPVTDEVLDGLARQDSLDAAMAEIRAMFSPETPGAAAIGGSDKSLAKLDDMSSRLNVLSNKGAAAAQRVEATLAAVRAEIDKQFSSVKEDLKAQIDALGSKRPDEGHVGVATLDAATLDNLSQRFDALEKSVADAISTDPAASSANADLLEAVTERLDDRFQKVDVRFREALDDRDAAMHQLIDRIAGLEGKIDALRTRPDPVLDLTPQRRSFGQFALAISTAVTRVEALADQIELRLAEAADTPDSENRVTEILQGLGRQLSSFEETACAKQEDMIALVAKADPLLKDLNQRITALHHRPDPVIDLTAQRQSLGQFALVLNKAVQRVEDIAGEVRTSLEQTGPDKTHTNEDSLAAFRAMTNRFETRFGGLFADISDQLREDIDGLAPQLERISQIEEKIDGLRGRPDPVLDLGPQRQAFAQFGLVLSETLRRFEALAAQIEAAAPMASAPSENAQVSIGPSDLTGSMTDSADFEVELQDPERIMVRHEDFLRDLRLSVAECLAQILRGLPGGPGIGLDQNTSEHTQDGPPLTAQQDAQDLTPEGADAPGGAKSTDESPTPVIQQDTLEEEVPRLEIQEEI